MSMKRVFPFASCLCVILLLTGAVSGESIQETRKHRIHRGVKYDNPVRSAMAREQTHRFEEVAGPTAKDVEQDIDFQAAGSGSSASSGASAMHMPKDEIVAKLAGDPDMPPPLVPASCEKSAADYGVSKDTPGLKSGPDMPALPEGCPDGTPGYKHGPPLFVPWTGSQFWQACPDDEPGYLGGHPLGPAPDCLPVGTPGYCGGEPLRPPPVGVPMGTPGYCGGTPRVCAPIQLHHVVANHPTEPAVIMLHPNMPQVSHDFDVDEPEHCIKEGYLAQVLKKTDINLDVPRTVVARPVFGVLNQHTFSIFENNNVKNLDTSYVLKDITDVTNDTTTSCFTLILKETIVSPDANLPEFCADNNANMWKWIDAILNFPTCEWPKTGDKEKNKDGQDGSPDSKVKDMVKKQMKKEEEEEQLEAQIAAAAQDVDEVEMQQQLEEKKERLRFEETMKKLNQEVKAAKVQVKLREKQLAKELQDKIAESEDKRRCIEEELTLQATASHTSQEVKQLQSQLAAQKRRNDERLEEARQKAKLEIEQAARESQQHIKELERQKRKVEQEVLDEIVAADRNQPDLCMKSNLFTPQGIPTAEATAVCTALYPHDANCEAPVAIAELTPDAISCLHNDSFCDMCCNKAIGRKNEALRPSCVEQCKAKMCESATQSSQQEVVETMLASTGSAGTGGMGQEAAQAGSETPEVLGASGGIEQETPPRPTAMIFKQLLPLLNQLVPHPQALAQPQPAVAA